MFKWAKRVAAVAAAGVVAGGVPSAQGAADVEALVNAVRSDDASGVTAALGSPVVPGDANIANISALGAATLPDVFTIGDSSLIGRVRTSAVLTALRGDTGLDIDLVSLDGLVALHYFVLLGNVNLVNDLIGLGADLTIPSSGFLQPGKTPVLFSPFVNSGSQALTILNALIAAGADVSATDSSGTTILHDAIKQTLYSNGERLALVNAALAASPAANPDSADGNGDTVLHVAISPDDSTLAILNAVLGASSASKDAVNNDGDAPIHKVIKEGSVATESLTTSMLNALLAVSPTLTATDNDDRTALHLAAQAGMAGPVNALIAAGLNDDVEDITGSTALHLIAARQATSGAECIVAATIAANLVNNAGSNATAVDDGGRTPLEVNEALGDLGCVNLQSVLGSDVVVPGSPNGAAHLVPWSSTLLSLVGLILALINLH